MAVENTQAMPSQSQVQSSSTQAASQSDTPQALKNWWAGFKNKRKKEEPAKVVPAQPARGIFGVPLAESIKYANVAISSIDENGNSFTYGYVPIVVAKCGVFLKDKATDVEGIFRLNGSAKRIKELQTAFDSPDRYGKGLDWTGYTVHDAANVLRRYLNNLPQPIVPLEFYERFREPLRNHSRAVENDSTATEPSKDFDHDKAITTYQQLITEIPPLNRQLLLYILDLLAVFASKADVNLMTSANLAAIFQPGVLSHPIHDMSPEAYRLSQDVLIFLIDNQDDFHIGLNGTAADEKTVKEFQGGSIPQQPSTPSKSGLGRSASNGSATGEGKRFSGLRRNVSTSSKNSRQSSQGPATPLSGHFGSSAVHRSNTVPSKKSPALQSSRFNRGIDSPSTPLALSPAIGSPTNRPRLSSNIEGDEEDANPVNVPTIEGLGLSQATPQKSGTVQTEASKEQSEPAATDLSSQNRSLNPAAVKSRKVSDVLLNLTGGPDKDGRQPNKLKKKRMPSNVNASGNSSTASLVGAEQLQGPSSRTPPKTPDVLAVDKPETDNVPIVDPADITPTADETDLQTPVPKSMATFGSDGSEDAGKLKPPTHQDQSQLQSATGTRGRSASQNSTHSKSSVTDMSEIDHDQTDEARAERKEKKRLWRFSQSAKKSKSPARVGSNAGAEQSSSSIGSWHRSRKSVSNDTNASTFEPIPSLPTTTTTITGGIDEKRSRSRGKSVDKSRDKSLDEDKEEKQGFFDKLKKKVNQAREEKKERTKSPQREGERSSSKQSLSAIANDSASPRRPSVAQQTIPEQIENDTVTHEKPEESKQMVAEASGEEAKLKSDEAQTTTETQPPAKTAEPEPSEPTVASPEQLPSTGNEESENKQALVPETEHLNTTSITEPSIPEPTPSIEHPVEQPQSTTAPTTETA